MSFKKNGFIATSIIYSFFLVFIALISALVSGFVANKLIMERFNSEVAVDLNTDKYKVVIYSKNANIADGVTFTNLISNGTFSSSLHWKTSGSATFSYASNRFGNYALYKNDMGYGTSYLYQQLYLLQNSKYYYTISHLDASSNSFKTYINTSSKGFLDTQNSKSDTWTKTSALYDTNSSETTNLYVASSNFASTAFFTNVMVINLTASFGKGREADKEWMDDNIEYFDGTISYIGFDQVGEEESLTVRLSPYAGYDRYNITCINPKTNGSVNGYNISNKVENGKSIKEFKINSVSSDIKCNIDWRM